MPSNPHERPGDTQAGIAGAARPPSGPHLNRPRPAPRISKGRRNPQEQERSRALPTRARPGGGKKAPLTSASLIRPTGRPASRRLRRATHRATANGVPHSPKGGRPQDRPGSARRHPTPNAAALADAARSQRSGAAGTTTRAANAAASGKIRAVSLQGGLHRVELRDGGLDREVLPHEERSRGNLHHAVPECVGLHRVELPERAFRDGIPRVGSLRDRDLPDEEPRHAGGPNENSSNERHRAVELRAVQRSEVRHQRVGHRRVGRSTAVRSVTTSYARRSTAFCRKPESGAGRWLPNGFALAA